jgi:hypothetical protein
MPDHLPDLPEALLAREQQLEREWWWLQGALNAAAQLHAERLRGEGGAAWFRKIAGAGGARWTGGGGDRGAGGGDGGEGVVSGYSEPRCSAARMRAAATLSRADASCALAEASRRGSSAVIVEHALPQR